MKTLSAFILIFLLAGTAQANHNPGGTIGAQEAICSNAAIIMCDNYEDRAIEQTDMAVHTYKNNGMAVSTTAATGPRITSDATGVYAGSRALKLTYPAGMNNGGGFLDTSFSSLGATRTLFIRWYQKHSSNFKWSYIATKNMEWIMGNGQPDIFSFNFTGNNATNNTQAGPTKLTKMYHYFTVQSDPWIPVANAGQGDYLTVAGDWGCLETQITVNTTTTSTDGILRSWVNDVLYWDYPNQNIVERSADLMQGILISGYWNCWGVATTGICDKSPEDDHPLMYRWVDNLVVSSERIGCIGNYGGGASSTPTRRFAPSINLRRAAVPSDIHLVTGAFQ